MRFSSGYRFKCTALLLFVISFLVTIQALAQSTDFNRYYENGKKKRFYVSVNEVFAMLETNIRFETLNGFLGIKIEAEDHLGLDKYKMMPVFTARINLGQRHHINAYYYYLRRHGSRFTEREFEFNGQIIELGTEIHAHADLHTASVGYLYELIREENAGLGVFANFYLTFASVGVSSNLEKINESVRFPGVLPNFGVMPYYKLSDRIGFSGIISLFFMNTNDFRGSVHTIGAQFDSHVTPWLDVGIGYYLFDVTMEAVESTFRGIFDYTYQGPFIGLGFRF